MTKSQEQFVIDRFKELYLPEANINRADPPWPDFIFINNSGEKIGIEITEVINNKDSQRDYSTRNEITDLVLDKLAPLLSFKFTLEIDLLPEGVRKSDKDKTVEEIVKMCLEEFFTIENDELIELRHINVDLNKADSFMWTMMMRNNFRNLPKGIKSIEIHRMDNAPDSWNPSGGGLAVPNFTTYHLNDILNRKERKIPNYEFCDEYWLVIWEGKLPSGYFDKVEIEMPIETKFDKVFITRTVKQELVILKP
jgi:hypothetical protein